jgi:hypothetical protein
MFMGPGDAGLLLGIMDNARLPGSFDFWRKLAAGEPAERRSTKRAVGRN